MFSLDSKEYVENGLYIIDGVEFYSIWTFKNKFHIGNNNNKQNKIDASNIEGMFHLSKPDFGAFRSIKIFPKHKLFKYFFSDI